MNVLDLLFYHFLKSSHFFLVSVMFSMMQVLGTTKLTHRSTSILSESTQCCKKRSADSPQHSPKRGRSTLFSMEESHTDGEDDGIDMDISTTICIKKAPEDVLNGRKIVKVRSKSSLKASSSNAAVGKPALFDRAAAATSSNATFPGFGQPAQASASVAGGIRLTKLLWEAHLQ